MFIMADPLEIVLFRTETKRTSDGGVQKSAEPVPLESQTFRLIPQSGPSSDVRNMPGPVAQESYVLMGEWDVDMAREDYFMLDGVRMTLSGPVEPDHSKESVYERKVAVTRNG